MSGYTIHMQKKSKNNLLAGNARRRGSRAGEKESALAEGRAFYGLAPAGVTNVRRRWNIYKLFPGSLRKRVKKLCKTI